MLWLVFQVPHLNFMSNIIWKFKRHLSILLIIKSSKACSETPRLLQAWCDSVTLGATCLSAPLNTHYTFYNLPRPLAAHYHAYNNPQQLAHKALVLQC